MTDNVYLVTKGYYSDYSILYATLDKKVAEDYVAAINHGKSVTDMAYGEGAEIEEWPLEVGPVEVWSSLRLETSITPGHPPRSQRPREERNVGVKSRASGASTEIRQYHPGRPVVIVTTGWDHHRVEKSHQDAVAREHAILSGIAS